MEYEFSELEGFIVNFIFDALWRLRNDLDNKIDCEDQAKLIKISYDFLEFASKYSSTYKAKNKKEEEFLAVEEIGIELKRLEKQEIKEAV